MVVSEIQFAVEQLPQMASIVTTLIPIAIGCVGYYCKGKWNTVRNRRHIPVGAEDITELKQGAYMGEVTYRRGLTLYFYHTCSPDAPKDSRNFGFTVLPKIS